MSDDELKITARSDGGELAVRGDSVARIVDALAGFVSPVTESTGYIGDVIRMYRQENVIRGISKANALAAELGLPVRPVHPKFLVNWIEGVSLEDETGDEGALTDMWAGLLVSSSRSLKPGHHLYRRILSELTAHHTKFLSELLGDESQILSQARFGDIAKKVNSFFDATELELDEESVKGNSLISVVNELEGPGICFSSIKLSATSGALASAEIEIWSQSSVECDHFEANHVIPMLISSGLVEEIDWTKSVRCSPYFETFDTKWNDKRGLLQVSAYVLTRMGREFALACHGE